MNFSQKIAVFILFCFIATNAQAGKHQGFGQRTAYKPVVYKPDLRQKRQQVYRAAEHLQKMSTPQTDRTQQTALIERIHPIWLQAAIPSTKQKILKIFLIMIILGMSHTFLATQQKTIGSYSVNLVWINRSLNETQTYICPDATNQAYGVNTTYGCLDGAFKWANVSQGGIVNFWYDSAMTPAQAVNNSRMVIQAHASVHPEMVPIVLRDVREIPTVAMHPEVFSHKISVYYRSDLLRVIIGLYILSRSEVDYFVYSDLDVEVPQSQQQLFDEKTLHNLQGDGFIMLEFRLFNEDGLRKLQEDGLDIKQVSYLENGFMMMSNHNKNMIKAMEFIIVDLSIQRAYSDLQGKFRIFGEKSAHLTQEIFYLFNEMYRYFLYLEEYRELICDHRQQGGLSHSFVYEQRHGLTPFGITDLYVDFCRSEPGGIFMRLIKGERRLKGKFVKLPPLSGYNQGYE